MAQTAQTLLATHNGTDLDGYASLVALRLLYPGAVLVLSDMLQDVVREAVASRPPPIPTISPHEVDPAAVKRVITADVPDLARIGGWAGRLLPETEVIAYDHHPQSESLKRRGNVTLVWGEVGSTCTLVSEELDKRGIVPEAGDATLLLAGLFEDTGQLSFRSATPRDFAAAHRLSLWGAEPAAAGDILQRLWDARQNDAYREIEQSCALVPWGGLTAAVARIDLPYFVPDAGALASRLHPPGADAVFLLAGLPQKVFVIARAMRAGVDVGDVAARLGGGGHAEAASAVLRGKSLVEAEEELRRTLEAAGPAAPTAAKLMNAPVIAVDAAATLAAAHELLVRQRIGTVVVTGEGGEGRGLLDFDTVAAAVAHGLGAERAALYARAPIQFVAPEAGLQELRRRLLTGGERMFVVGTAGQMLGVVTRRDILRALYEQSLPAFAYGEERPARGLGHEIRTQLGAAAEADLRRIGALAASLGLEIYLVGGTVRDLVLRRKPTDWDLVVVGDMTPLLARLRDEGAVVKTHGRFQTAHVQFADGMQLDLATARRETYHRPGALPDVSPAGLEYDLVRRDFTINAMAIELAPSSFGRLVDRFRGLEDLKHRRIRVLHSLSFVDDPTRAFRALRLAVRFAFEVSDDTSRLIDRAVALRMMVESEGTRLRRELLLALREAEPLAVLRAFELRGLLRACLEDYQLEPHEPFVLRMLEWTGWYRLQTGRAVEHEDTLLLGALTLGGSVTRGETILRAFKIPPAETERWGDLRAVAAGLEGAAIRTGPLSKPSLWMPLLDRAGVGALLVWGAMHPERRPTITDYLTRWSLVKPAVTGEDLLRLGVPRGPEMGALLVRIRNRVLDGECPPDRQAQIDLAGRLMTEVEKKE